MIKTYIIGIAGFITLVIIWVVVQSLWRNAFSDHITDEDVLAGRGGCSNCGCTSICMETNEPISIEK